MNTDSLIQAMYKFSDKSYNNLVGVSPKLISVASLAIALTSVDFGIVEGLRTKERQEELVKAGKSQTMSSKHLDGNAIDILAYVNGKGTYEWKYYEEISKYFKYASTILGVPIHWGGDWKTFKDGVHFELVIDG